MVIRVFGTSGVSTDGQLVHVCNFGLQLEQQTVTKTLN